MSHDAGITSAYVHVRGQEHVVPEDSSHANNNHEERWIEAIVGGRKTLVRNQAYGLTGLHRCLKIMFRKTLIVLLHHFSQLCKMGPS
jgi:hypothetical protein